jgi:hypothetical protein
MVVRVVNYRFSEPHAMVNVIDLVKTEVFGMAQNRLVLINPD